MCHPGVRLMTGCKIDAANISTLSFWTHIPSPVLRGKSWIKIEIWLGRTSNHPTDYFRAEKNEPPVADAFRSGERRDINLTITHKNQDDPPRSQYQSTESIHWHHKSPQAMVTPEQMALWWDLNLAAIKWLRTEILEIADVGADINIETLKLLSFQETKKEREEETAAYKEAFDHYDWNRSGTIPTSVSL